MDKRQANKLARQLGNRFDVLFKNTFVTHQGRHWKLRVPDQPADVASHTITTTCEPTRVVESKPSTYCFRVSVDSAEPRFVEAAFFPNQLREELRGFFKSEHFQLVNEQVDLRKGELFFVFRAKNEPRYFHFQFRINK